MIQTQVYEQQIRNELQLWQEKMQKKESFTGWVARGIQEKINHAIPEKIHQLITDSIRHMVKAVLAGSEYTSTQPLMYASLEERESLVNKKISTYKKMAAVEGAGTGAGGFLLSVADFPLLLGLQIKLLFEIASLYGHPVKDYQERLFILHVFMLSFSSQEKRIESYHKILNWEATLRSCSISLYGFDWRAFQQEYRDYIDLAKLLQMIPGVGAVVGAVANHRLVDKLGETAMNAYRIRRFDATQTTFGE